MRRERAHDLPGLCFLLFPAPFVGALGSPHIPARFETQGSKPEGLPRVAHKLRQIHTCFRRFPKNPRLERDASTFFLHGVIQDVWMPALCEILLPLCLMLPCPDTMLKYKPGLSSSRQLRRGGASAQLPECRRALFGTQVSSLSQS